NKYFEVRCDIKNKLEELDFYIKEGGQFILHQGPLKKERGRVLLSNFAQKIVGNRKILLIGGNKQDFELFLKEFNLSRELFWFVGTIEYKYLPLFWKRASFSIVIYLSTYLNNKLCAPNRLYLSYFSKIPVIVNKSNPVLSNFIITNKCGIFVEDFIERKVGFDELKAIQIEDQDHQKLIEIQRGNLLSVYNYSL